MTSHYVAEYDDTYGAPEDAWCVRDSHGMRIVWNLTEAEAMRQAESIATTSKIARPVQHVGTCDAWCCRNTTPEPTTPSDRVPHLRDFSAPVESTDWQAVERNMRLIGKECPTNAQEAAICARETIRESLREEQTTPEPTTPEPFEPDGVKTGLVWCPGCGNIPINPRFRPACKVCTDTTPQEWTAEQVTRTFTNVYDDDEYPTTPEGTDEQYYEVRCTVCGEWLPEVDEPWTWRVYNDNQPMHDACATTPHPKRRLVAAPFLTAALAFLAVTSSALADHTQCYQSGHTGEGFPVISCPAEGTTYYVDLDGTDGTLGTEGDGRWIEIR
jgi:hypothetical protein